MRSGTSKRDRLVKSLCALGVVLTATLIGLLACDPGAAISDIQRSNPSTVEPHGDAELMSGVGRFASEKPVPEATPPDENAGISQPIVNRVEPADANRATAPLDVRPPNLTGGPTSKPLGRELVHATSPFAMYRRTAGRAADYEHVSATGRCNIAWTTDAPFDPLAGMECGDVALFVARDRRAIVLVQPSDGAIAARVELDAELVGMPVIAGSRLIYFAEDDTLVSIDLRDGKREWMRSVRVGTGGDRRDVYSCAALILPNGRVLVSSNELVYCVNAVDGSVKWYGQAWGSRPTTISASETHAFVLGGGWMRVPDPDAHDPESTGEVAPKLLAVSVEDGAVAWERELPPTDWPVTPVVLGGRVLLPYPKGSALAIDAVSSFKLWPQASVEVTGGQSDECCTGTHELAVSVTEAPSRVVAFDIATGAQKWTSPLPSPCSVPPISCADATIVLGQDGRLRLIQLDSGAVVEVPDVVHDPRFEPFIVGVMLFAKSSSGAVCCYRLGS